MKTLVVYYSRTGNTKKVAEMIAKKLKADIEEIIDLKNRKGRIGYLFAGRDASLKKLRKIKPIEKNPEDYDLVIVGTPVWAWTITPAVRTYLTDNKIKRSAFFCTCGDSSGKKIFNELLSLAVDTKLLATLELTTGEIKKGAEKKIDEFVQKLN